MKSCDARIGVLTFLNFYACPESETTFQIDKKASEITPEERGEDSQTVKLKISLRNYKVLSYKSN